MTHDMSICAHCGKPIVWLTATWTWLHDLGPDAGDVRYRRVCGWAEAVQDEQMELGG